MNKLQLVDIYAARILMVSFFLPMQLQVAVAMAVCLYFVGRTLFAREKIERSGLLSSFILGALFLAYFVGALSSMPADRDEAWMLCGNRISLLVFPLAFAIITPARRKLIFGELVYFVYTCFLVTLVANICFVYKFATSPGGLHSANNVLYRIYFEQVTNLHPTYLSMYICFSICLLLLHGQAVNRVLKYILFYGFLVFLISLLAKSPLIALVIIFVHYAWLKRGMLIRHKWFFAGTLVVMVSAYTFIPFISQRLNEMTGISQATHGGKYTDNSINTRKMIWTVDNTMLKHYWVAGAGPGRMMHQLKERYLFQSIYYGYDVNFYDPHNEYLYDWLSLGLAGMLCLVCVLLIHFVTAIKARQYIYLYFMLILAVTFFTESVLTRQQGVMFFALFTSLFFFKKSKVPTSNQLL